VTASLNNSHKENTVHHFLNEVLILGHTEWFHCASKSIWEVSDIVRHQNLNREGC